MIEEFVIHAPEAKLNSLELAYEEGWKQGYEDYEAGFDGAVSPYPEESRETIRWNFGYSVGYNQSHRNAGHRR